MFSQGFTGAFVALLASAQLATAHMEIKNPAPFRSQHNPNAVKIDYTNTAPLAKEGTDYPCKGYHADFGTPAGKSVATYAPGQQYNFEVIGGAPHGGGSCQVSLSYDRGATFKVIQSIEGGCPLSSNYPFTIPSDAPEGEAIWAWTWSNKIGNREFYMNCAAVTISKGAAKRDAVVKRASVPFSARPPLFVANLDTTSCKVSEGTDVRYPNAGPDVIQGPGNLVAPNGNCGPSGPSGGNGGGNGGGAAPPPPPSSSAQAPVVTPAPTPSKPVSLPGGVFLTVPGEASSSAAPVVTAPVETPAPAPTTLVISTRPAAPTQGAGNGNGGGSTGGPAGAHTAGTPCTNEGAWNCVGGAGFQRCASGAWSPVISMAAGTKCTAGESDTLITVKKRRSFRHGHVHGSRHHA